MSRTESLDNFVGLATLTILLVAIVSMLVSVIFSPNIKNTNKSNELQIAHKQFYIEKEVETMEILKQEYLTNNSLNKYEKRIILNYIHQFDPNPKYREWAKQEMENL